MLDLNDSSAMQPDRSADISASESELTTDEAVTWFDSLPPVDIGFMIGSWRGSGVPTGHPMDGMLEAANWRGKRFIDADNVHPLVFDDGKGGTFMVNPAILPMGLAQRLPRKPYITRIFLASRRLIATSRSAARIRMIEYRGVTTATMIYDAKAINDVFRKIDDDTVLGLMDMKGMERPFFFKLERDATVDDHTGTSVSGPGSD